MLEAFPKASITMTQCEFYFERELKETRSLETGNWVIQEAKKNNKPNMVNMKLRETGKRSS